MVRQKGDIRMVLEPLLDEPGAAVAIQEASVAAVPEGIAPLKDFVVILQGLAQYKALKVRASNETELLTWLEREDEVGVYWSVDRIIELLPAFMLQPIGVFERR